MCKAKTLVKYFEIWTQPCGISIVFPYERLSMKMAREMTKIDSWGNPKMVCFSLSYMYARIIRLS